jgi:hypothetical protein
MAEQYNSGKPITPPSTVDTKAEYSGVSSSTWLQRAQQAYQNSTSFVDTNYRKHWEDSISMFNSEHPSDSKYNAPQYDKRSKIFRPKTRAIIRKIEAASAAAFFSNSDIVSITAQNASDKAEVLSADVMKALLEWRLTNSIPWFQIVQGGIQDAAVQGAVIAHVHWKLTTRNVAKATNDLSDNEFYTNHQSNINSVNDTPYTGPVSPLKDPKEVFSGETQNGPSIGHNYGSGIGDGEQRTGKEQLPRGDNPKIKAYVNEVVEDKPCIDIIPIENFRIDPAASWIDPIGTSPYIIHLIPMYVGDVKVKMNTGEWKPFPEAMIKSALQNKSDTTNEVRQKGKIDPYESDGKTIADYELVWVQRHIHRHNGRDWEFFTLGEVALLTEPQPLEKNVFHGERPYVMGTINLETHKVFASSLPELSKQLQEEANEIANQRLDNVKMVLNKRYIVARNKQVDIGSLVRNVPGGITMADDVEKDIREVSFPDVTQSSYAEQDRINGDMDELMGNFSAGSIATNRQLAETAKGMSLLSQNTNIMVEYQLRTFVETFVEPVLKQLIKLEQHYETDQDVLAIAGANAQARQKYGVDKITDDMLDHQMTLKVNVGMGATSPDQKIQKLTQGVGAFMNIATMAQKVPVLNVQEVAKELFGALGYADGSRFINQQIDPQVAQLQQAVKQLQMALKTRSDLKQQDNQTKLQVATQNNQTKLALANIKNKHEANQKAADRSHDGNKMLAQNYIDHMRNQDYSQLNSPAQEQPQPQQPAPGGPGNTIG